MITVLGCCTYGSYVRIGLVIHAFHEQWLHARTMYHFGGRQTFYWVEMHDPCFAVHA